jgi:hypothetical protein
MQDYCNLTKQLKVQIVTALSPSVCSLQKHIVLQQQDGTIWEQRILRLRGVLTKVMEATLAFIDLISASEIILDGNSCNSKGAWSWINQVSNNIHFRLTNTLAYSYLADIGMDKTCWNETSDSNKTWKACWTKLWASNSSYRAKMFIWQVLAKGLFTGAQAVLMGHQAVLCKVCPLELETTPHLFETCRHARRSWQTLTSLHSSLGSSLKLPP